MKIEPVRAGLSLGILLATIHFVAVLLVALTNGAFVDWVLSLHHIRTALVFLPLDIATLIIGTVFAGVIGFVVGALFALIWNAFEPATKPAAPAPLAKAGGQKAVDPVCGMEVDPETAPKETYKGKTYYFCSPSCKAEFKESPEKFVKKK